MQKHRYLFTAIMPFLHFFLSNMHQWHVFKYINMYDVWVDSVSCLVGHSVNFSSGLVANRCSLVQHSLVQYSLVHCDSCSKTVKSVSLHPHVYMDDCSVFSIFHLFNIGVPGILNCNCNWSLIQPVQMITYSYELWCT